MKKANRVKLIVISLISLAFTGCSNSFQSFNPRMHALSGPMPTDMKARNEIQVSVEEFVSATKARTVFDADVAREGVLALVVAMKNNSKKDYILWKRQIRVFQLGEPLKSIPAYQAAREAHSPGVFWNGIASLALLPIGILISPSTMNLVDKKIEEHFERLELTDKILKPGDTTYGFVYFEFPHGWLGANKSEPLTVHVTLEEDTHGDYDGQSVSFELTVPALEIS